MLKGNNNGGLSGMQLFVYQVAEFCSRMCLSSNLVLAFLVLLWLNMFTVSIMLWLLPLMANEEYLCSSTRLLHVSFCSWLDGFFQLVPATIVFLFLRSLLLQKYDIGTTTAMGVRVQLHSHNILLPRSVNRWFKNSKAVMSPLVTGCVALGAFIFALLCVYYFSFYSNVFADGYLATSIPKLLHTLSTKFDDDFVTQHHGSATEQPCALNEQDRNDREFLTKHVLESLLSLKSRPLIFPAYGTVLGYTRYRGFLPWDSDVDLGVVKESMAGVTTHEMVHALRNDKKGINDVYFDYWLGVARVQYKNVRVDVTIWKLDRTDWVLTRDNVDSMIFFLNYSLYHTLPISAIMDGDMANRLERSHKKPAGHHHSPIRSDENHEAIWHRMMGEELKAKQYGEHHFWIPMVADPITLIQRFYPLSWWKELRPAHCKDFQYQCWDKKMLSCPEMPAFVDPGAAPFEPKFGLWFIVFVSIGIPYLLYTVCVLSEEAGGARKEN